MEEIKIESFSMLGGELGLEPKDKIVWLYKALDLKTNKYLGVIVNQSEKPDKEFEEKIYKYIAFAFKRAENEIKS